MNDDRQVYDYLKRVEAYVDTGELDEALKECKLAIEAWPEFPPTYNYRGLLLLSLNEIDLAIEAFLKAIELDSAYYTARQNLATARILWEEEQYLRFLNAPSEDSLASAADMNLEAYLNSGSLDSIEFESEETLPGWLYLDASAHLLRGWAGHRIRPGRSGYDPLDSQFENAHIQGVIIRKLFTGRLRTRNPLYLILMTCYGALLAVFGAALFTVKHWIEFVSVLFVMPYMLLGIALLVNVFLSLRLGKLNIDEDEGNVFV